MNSSHSRTSRPEILDEITIDILERPQCEEDTDKYLENVLDYCKKDYQEAAYKKRNEIDLTINEIKEKIKIRETNITHF